MAAEAKAYNLPWYGTKRLYMFDTEVRRNIRIREQMTRNGGQP